MIFLCINLDCGKYNVKDLEAVATSSEVKSLNECCYVEDNLINSLFERLAVFHLKDNDVMIEIRSILQLLKRTETFLSIGGDDRLTINKVSKVSR